MEKISLEDLAKNKLAVLSGDVIENLKRIPSESVQCVVTSPPYWGLRDYKVPPSIWGGHPECAHVWGAESFSPLGRPQGATSQRKNRTFVLNERSSSNGAHCQICGAWRGCLGLEPNPEMYVNHIRIVFAEIWRVLRKDGTIWVNMGDCYAGSGKGPSKAMNHNEDRSVGVSKPFKGYGLKPKDLIGMPWRVAFALQADGWYHRQGIIWEKDNPLPESCKDRPTTSHEYLFFMTKRKKYYYDYKAIQEPVTGGAHSRGDGLNPKAIMNTREDGIKQNESYARAMNGMVEMRNKRSVWKISTQAFPGAHFATYPEKLVEPCVLAGTKAGDVVLNPFAGSFTTCKVAIGLGRLAIGIEINPEYIKLGLERCNTTIGFGF